MATTLTRRTLLGGISALFAMPVRSEPSWPDRPITLVHGLAAGGPTDTVARIVAEELSRRLGQPILIDPRPGGSGTVAAGQVARAARDGYTLIAIPGGHAAAAALYKKLPYQTIDDFSMISMTSEYPFAFVTYADHTIQTMDDLIRTARDRPTPLLYGSPGIGSVHHLSVELLARMANIKLQYVPYRGSAQAMTDLIGKRIDFMIDPPTLLIEFVRDGRLRALGTTGANRFFGMPDIPTLTEEALPGYEITSWQGLAAPAGVSHSIIERLSHKVEKVLAEPTAVARLKVLGNDAKPMSPDAFKARIVADVTKWTAIVEAAHIERI